MTPRSLIPVKCASTPRPIWTGSSAAGAGPLAAAKKPEASCSESASLDIAELFVRHFCEVDRRRVVELHSLLLVRIYLSRLTQKWQETQKPINTWNAPLPASLSAHPPQPCPDMRVNNRRNPVLSVRHPFLNYHMFEGPGVISAPAPPPPLLPPSRQQLVNRKRRSAIMQNPPEPLMAEHQCPRSLVHFRAHVCLGGIVVHCHCRWLSETEMLCASNATCDSTRGRAQNSSPHVIARSPLQQSCRHPSARWPRGTGPWHNGSLRERDAYRWYNGGPSLDPGTTGPATATDAPTARRHALPLTPQPSVTVYGTSCRSRQSSSCGSVTPQSGRRDSSAW